MNRPQAYELVHSRLGDGPTFAHCLAAEACMSALAARLGGDPAVWGLAGLVHDLDLDECATDLEQHALVGARVLEAAGAPAEVVHAVLGHNDKVERTSLLDQALWVVDPTTGFIVASALIRPSKSTSDLTIKSIKNRMKEKRFAEAVNRDQIRACTSIGLELDEFLGLCLSAMDAIRGEIGLAGVVPADAP